MKNEKYLSEGQKERFGLIGTISNVVDQLFTMSKKVDDLKEQNKAYRELLERVIKSSHPIWENRNTDLVNEIIKAKELLKGGEDDKD